MKKYALLMLLIPQILWANDKYRMIDGKNYYEVLGVNRSATKDDIKAAFRRKMKDAHPDRGGSEQMAKDINEANDTLKDDHERGAYDFWLDSNQRQSSRGPRPGSGHRQGRRQQTDEELRHDVIVATVRDIDRKVNTWLQERQNLTYDQLAERAMSIILYNVRFFPMANMELTDLESMIFNYSLDPLQANKYSEVGMVALAGAAIKVLLEREQEYHYSSEARRILRRVESHLVDGMRGKEHYDLRVQYLNHIYTILKGESFFDQQGRPVRRQNMSAAEQNCESSLGTVRVRVRGPDGREYEIPINISVKIGF